MSDNRLIFRIDDKSDLEDFDRLISLMGFQSRSDYFRSCVAVTVHGAALAEASGKIDPIAHGWINRQKRYAAKKHSEETALLLNIDRMAKAIIAMKGVKTAYRALKDDIIRQTFEDTGRAFTADEVADAMTAYQMYHRAELDDYRTNTAREIYAAED